MFETQTYAKMRVTSVEKFGVPTSTSQKQYKLGDGHYHPGRTS